MNTKQKLGILSLLVAVLLSACSENDNTLWDQHSSIRDHFKELQLNIDCDGVGGKLLARVYNEGVAFRFVLNEGRKPGKTLWDWRVHGYIAPDGFVYGINTESYFRFIDFADETGIEYFLIDDAWYKHVTKGHFEMSDELDLQAVIDYAADKSVELMLYYDRRHGEYGDDELFPYYQSFGMKGIKYGFIGNNVNFTREAIQKSAQSQLLIDFHDGPVPFTGIRRTYPNAVTREYCHAQQDSRRAFTPESFIKMALINAITGPLDRNTKLPIMKIPKKPIVKPILKPTR